jgi:hypothetical protein
MFRGMRHHLVSYVRLLAASLAAFAVAACVRLAPPSAFAPSPEPRFTDAPPADQLAAPGPGLDDDARIESIHARLAAVEAEIVNLRKVLDVLGPLPEHADLFIPVDPAELDARSEQAAEAFLAHAGLGCFGAATETPAIAIPVRAGYHGLDEGIELALDEDAALDALCVELSAISGPASVVAPIRAW